MRIELLSADANTKYEIISTPSDDGGNFVLLRLTRLYKDGEYEFVDYCFDTESELAEFIRALKFIKEEAFK